MNIHIHNQQLKVGCIDVLDLSASANLQIGDNDQVLLYSTIETSPTSIQIGPFPSLYPNGAYGPTTKTSSPFRKSKHK